MSSQLAQMDNRLNQTTAKADQALEDLQRLKLDRKLVLDLKQGASFGSNSTVLTDQSKKDIDSLLSDLSGDAGGTSGLMFVVAGYTDNTGSAKYNYELALIRAANAASYLTTDKKIDPGRMVVMSLGRTPQLATMPLPRAAPKIAALRSLFTGTSLVLALLLYEQLRDAKTIGAGARLENANLVS